MTTYINPLPLTLTEKDKQQGNKDECIRAT